MRRCRRGARSACRTLLQRNAEHRACTHDLRPNNTHTNAKVFVVHEPFRRQEAQRRTPGKEPASEVFGATHTLLAGRCTSSSFETAARDACIARHWSTRHCSTRSTLSRVTRLHLLPRNICNEQHFTCYYCSSRLQAARRPSLPPLGQSLPIFGCFGLRLGLLLCHLLPPRRRPPCIRISLPAHGNRLEGGSRLDTKF